MQIRPKPFRSRRLPLRPVFISLAWTVTGTTIATYGERYGFAELPSSVMVFGGLMLVAVVGQWPILIYYALSPKQLVFAEQAMIYGARTYPYVEMGSIEPRFSLAATRVRTRKSEQLVLRWDVWPDFEIYNRILEERTSPHLHNELRARRIDAKRSSSGRVPP